jgi:diketogulonate reductase-like aldo/keto reductase
MASLGFICSGTLKVGQRKKMAKGPTATAVGWRIARRRGVHPAVVCIRWAVQRGQIPIPFSTKRANYVANLWGAVGEPLTDAEMREIAGTDRNCRLIKGQVFLWKANQTWEDLWDLNGEIAK